MSSAKADQSPTTQIQNLGSYTRVAGAGGSQGSPSERNLLVTRMPEEASTLTGVSQQGQFLTVCPGTRWHLVALLGDEIMAWHGVPM